VLNCFTELVNILNQSGNIIQYIPKSIAQLPVPAIKSLARRIVYLGEAKSNLFLYQERSGTYLQLEQGKVCRGTLSQIAHAEALRFFRPGIPEKL
jgi:hypothetical protein